MIYTDQVVLTAAVMGLGSIATGEFILVKHDGTDDLAADSSSDWKAKVLEVRALDEEHVYIRVSWLNRPEDLAGGRRDYHGKNELVPTNQIDIIDATTVNGKFDLKRWTEMKNINPDDALRKEVYYWSQTLDPVPRLNTNEMAVIYHACLSSFGDICRYLDVLIPSLLRSLQPHQDDSLLERFPVRPIIYLRVLFSHIQR